MPRWGLGGGAAVLMSVAKNVEQVCHVHIRTCDILTFMDDESGYNECVFPIVTLVSDP